jgi:hypothetical protein
MVYIVTSTGSDTTTEEIRRENARERFFLEREKAFE